MKASGYQDWFNVYYSQNREDLILHALLSDYEKGFYVDIGAHDPTVFSVTKLFYDNGWNGINIEPQKKFYKKLLAARPRDINLNLAISEKNGESAIREYSNATGLSTLSDVIKHGYSSDIRLKDVTENYHEHVVKTSTLADVLKEHIGSNQIIHFLKIDVEGYEFNVIKGNDWKKYRPLVLCIESNHIVDDWNSLIMDAGYKEFMFEGLNRYFITSECYDRLAKNFDYAGRVLNKIPLSYTPYNLFVSDIKKINKENIKLNRIISEQDTYIKERLADIEKMDKVIKNYEEELLHLRGVKKRVEPYLKIADKISRVKKHDWKKPENDQ